MLHLTAFIGVVLAICVLRPLAPAAGLIDLPGGRRQHADAVPLIGGLAIAQGLLLALALRAGTGLGGTVSGQLPPPPALLAAALVVLAGGLLDDLHELSARVKLLFQIIAASLLAGWGGTLVLHVGALVSPEVQGLGVALVVPFTVLGMVGVMNAVNMIDGADGLAGGVALSALLWFGVAAALAGLAGHVWLISLIAAAVAAYLCFNAGGPLARKYKVFLGDAGSLLLGLLLAWIAIELAMAPAAAVSPIAAVWILAVPICDSVSLMLRRMLRRRSPFSADREHLHHVLQDAGLSRAAAVGLMVAINTAFGGIALWAQRNGVPEHYLFYSAMFIFVAYTGFCLRFYAQRTSAAAAAAAPLSLRR